MLLNFHHHHHKFAAGIYNRAHGDGELNQWHSCGLHPCDIGPGWEQLMTTVKALSQHPQCITIGECGLDSRVRDITLQKTIFSEQIDWAAALGKPLIIHCVRQYGDVMHLCRSFSGGKAIHGFNRGESLAKKLIASGFHLSFGKALLRSVSLQTTVKALPIQRIFLETDDEDFSLVQLYELTAALKDISTATLEDQLLDNFQNFRNER